MVCCGYLFKPIHINKTISFFSDNSTNINWAPKTCHMVVGNKVTKMHEKNTLSCLMTQYLIWQMCPSYFLSLLLLDI